MQQVVLENTTALSTDSKLPTVLSAREEAWWDLSELDNAAEEEGDEGTAKHTATMPRLLEPDAFQKVDSQREGRIDIRLSMLSVLGSAYFKDGVGPP